MTQNIGKWTSRMVLGSIISVSLLFASSEFGMKEVKGMLKRYQKTENKELFIKNLEKEMKHHPTETVKKVMEVIESNEVEEFLKNDTDKPAKIRKK